MIMVNDKNKKPEMKTNQKSAGQKPAQDDNFGNRAQGIDPKTPKSHLNQSQKIDQRDQGSGMNSTTNNKRT
jgi:hypothetical protein